MDLTQLQIVEATQLAAEAQSVAQLASSTITDYEKKMTDILSTVAQLQQLVIDERKNRIKLESQLSSAQDKIGSTGTAESGIDHGESKAWRQKLQVGRRQLIIQMTSQSLPVASGQYSGTITDYQAATMVKTPKKFVSKSSRSLTSYWGNTGRYPYRPTGPSTRIFWICL